MHEQLHCLSDTVILRFLRLPTPNAVVRQTGKRRPASRGTLAPHGLFPHGLLLWPLSTRSGASPSLLSLSLSVTAACPPSAAFAQVARRRRATRGGAGRAVHRIVCPTSQAARSAGAAPAAHVRAPPRPARVVGGMCCTVRTGWAVASGGSITAPPCTLSPSTPRFGPSGSRLPARCTAVPALRVPALQVQARQSSARGP